MCAFIVGTPRGLASGRWQKGVQVAQKVQVLLVCDVHGDDTVGDETITFSLEGSAYEVDVCEKHADETRDASAPFLGAPRRSAGRGGAGPRRPRRAPPGSGSGDRQKVTDIRAWAKAQGLAVSERGRIARAVIEQYQAVSARPG